MDRVKGLPGGLALMQRFGWVEFDEDCTGDDGVDAAEFRFVTNYSFSFQTTQSNCHRLISGRFRSDSVLTGMTPRASRGIVPAWKKPVT